MADGEACVLSECLLLQGVTKKNIFFSENVKYFVVSPNPLPVKKAKV